MKKIYTRLIRSASVILFLLGYVTAFAQQHTVTGTIVDIKGATMPGVNVLKKGTTIGTSTDADGKFKIEASDEDILIASFIGYESQEIRVGNQSTINITLTEDIALLSEIVVVGYGTQKKSDLTGAISSVSGENLRGTITSSVDQALQGRVAGVQVTQNSGQPGSVTSVRIRGTTSITGNGEPLYVVDGIQISGQGGAIEGFSRFGGSGGQATAAVNPLAAINPADIESIEVLKDASATAIYGSRAANGVVMITTKRGKKGASTVSYNGFYGVQEVYKTFDMMDMRAYADYQNEVAAENPNITPNSRFADPSLLGAGTDWQDAIYRAAPMQSHTLTVSGGSDNTKFMVSGGYFKQDGVIINSGFDRFNVRTNIDTKIGDRVKIGASVSFARKKETIMSSDGGDGVVSQAAQMPPHIPVKNFDGTYAGPNAQEASGQVGANPVALAYMRNNTALNNRLMTNLTGEAEIVKGLTFRSEIAVDIANTINNAFFPSYQWGRISNPVSQLAYRTDFNFNWLWKNYFTYTKSFGSHEITALLGTEALKNQYEGITAFKKNLPNSLPVMSQGQNPDFINTGYKGWNSIASQFARVNYSFADRYLVTATLRRDGSSRFGANNRYGVFPSASVAWKISSENFFGQSDVVSNLKLRAGWGKVGNQDIANFAYGVALGSVNTWTGPGLMNTSYPNPNVQWEATASTNIGVDVELFSGRVNLTLDAYSKKTNDLLMRVTLPAAYGEQIQGPLANVGSLENKGFEAGVNTINIDKGKLKWSTSANISINRNKVLDLGSAPINRALYWYEGFQTPSRTLNGYPVGQFYGYVMEGIFTSKEEILAHAVQIRDGNTNVNLVNRATGLWLGDVKFKDINGDGVINTSDQTIIGDPNPDFTFGFNNTVSYGPFTLDVFLLGSVGGDILNYSRARNEGMTTTFDNQSMTVRDRARTQLRADGGGNINNIDDVELINPNTSIPRYDDGNQNRNHHMSTRWIEDGTYVRVQNVKLSYSLPVTLAKKARLTSAQFYTNIQNVATFTNYSGLDPVIGAFNQSSLQQNVDMGRYPSPRVYTLGVNLNF